MAKKINGKLNEVTKEQFVSTAGRFYRIMGEQEERIIELEAENLRFLAYIKKLCNKGTCSQLAVARECGIPYREVRAWMPHKNPDEKGGE